MAAPSVSGESSVLGCLKKRHEFRTLIKARIAYGHLGEEQMPGNDILQSCSAFNLVVGEHFTKGAVSWRDANRDGRNLVQNVVNAFAHLTHGKTLQGVSSIMPPCKCRLIVEPLVNPSEEHQGSYEVTGHRVWLLTAADRSQFRAYLEERRKLGTLAKGKGKRLHDDGGADAAAPATKKRRNNEGEAAPMAPPPPEPEEPALDPARIDESFSPLAIGLRASHDDARFVSKRVEVERGKEELRRQKQANKTRGRTTTPQAESELPLALQNVDVSAMMPFHYIEATSDIGFHLQSVVKYVAPHRVAVPTQPGPNERPLTAGQFVDPRSFMTFTAHVQTNLQMGITNRRHPLNPDNIFSKEAAMVYHTRQQDGKRLVCFRQTDLAHYAQGASSSSSSSFPPSRNEILFCVGVPDGYMSPVEDAHEPDGDDLLDPDPAIAELIAQVNADDAHGAPNAFPFHHKLEGMLDLKIADSVRMQFPFPALVKVLNPSMASPEGIGFLELPFPIGHVLTAKEMTTGERDVDGDAIAEMAAHTVALAKYEDVINAEYRLRHPNAPKLGVVSAVAANLRETDQRSDLQTTLQMKQLSVPELVDKEQVQEILTAQSHIVTLAMLREAERTRTDPYQSLFRKVADPESHNESMSISDFLPFAFVFGPDHVGTVRGHVESYLREKYYAVMETLAPPERVNAEQELRTKTEDLVKQIAEKEVDDIAAYFVEHDDFLKVRQGAQVRAAVTREMMKEDLRDLQKRNPVDYEAQCIKLRNLFQFDIVSNRIKKADETIAILQTSENIADVLKSPDFRAWFLKNCTPKMMKALGADMPIMVQDAMPFNVCIQELADYAYGELGIRTGNGLLLFTITFGGALDSQMWAAVRLLPGINTIVAGETATGKSFNSRAVERSMPPGIVQNMSNFSAQAFHTSSNNDNVLVIQEEGKASLLAPNDEDRKRGGSNDLNLQKDLLTRFAAISKRATTNKDTGVTSTTTSISSAHLSWLINSNLKTTFLDGPYSRRFILFVLAVLQGEASIQPEQLQELDMLRDDFSKRDSVKRMQITFAMYITLRSMIKAGVLPAPDRTGANLIVVAVLKELGVRADSTQLHHFLQFAENYQLYYAAYMVCWSPYQAYYHAKPDGAERWSGQAIIELATPFVTSVSTAPVVFALTTLDFMLVPKYLNSFLCDLADALHMAHPEKRNYRRLETVDRNARPEYDVNYLILEGATWDGILETVAARNGMYKLRGDDVRNLLNKINTTAVTGKNFRAQNFRADGLTPLLIEEDPMSEILSFVPFEFETNTRGPRGAKRSVFAVSVHFLALHFKRDACQPGQWTEMHQKPIAVKENSFNLANAEQIGYVALGDSPMARALDHVLSNKTTLKSPFDPVRGLPPQCFDYMTGYTPLPVKLSVQVPTGHGRPPKTEEFRRGLDGIFMVQRLRRNEARDPIRRENAHAPTRTMAERMRLRRELLKKQLLLGGKADDHNDDGVDDVRLDEVDTKHAILFTTSEYDGEFVLQKYCAKKYGAMTPLCYLRLFGYSEQEIEAFVDGAMRVPETFPLGFGPLTYLLQRKICEEMGYPIGKAVYPRDNIHEQLTKAMFTHRFKQTPSTLHRSEDLRRIVDFRDIADTTPLGQVSFGNADRESPAEQERIRTFANAVSNSLPYHEDAMNIDDS
jgi:hypothetical protein